MSAVWKLKIQATGGAETEHTAVRELLVADDLPAALHVAAGRVPGVMVLGGSVHLTYVGALPGKAVA